MDELSRDLMRGIGGLEAIEGAADGNLSEWADGETIRQSAGRQAPPASSASRPMPSGAARAVLLLAAVIAIVLLVAAL